MTAYCWYIPREGEQWVPVYDRQHAEDLRTQAEQHPKGYTAGLSPQAYRAAMKGRVPEYVLMQGRGGPRGQWTFEVHALKFEDPDHAYPRTWDVVTGWRQMGRSDVQKEWNVEQERKRKDRLLCLLL